MAYPHDSTSERTSVLGPTLRFKGELSAAEDLLIHGQVEGTVGPAPRVTIGSEAIVKAMVTADVIVVEGKVEGDLKAQTSITVRRRWSSCRLRLDCLAASRSPRSGIGSFTEERVFGGQRSSTRTSSLR